MIQLDAQDRLTIQQLIRHFRLPTDNTDLCPSQNLTDLPFLSECQQTNDDVFLTLAKAVIDSMLEKPEILNKNPEAQQMFKASLMSFIKQLPLNTDQMTLNHWAAQEGLLYDQLPLSTHENDLLIRLQKNDLNTA